MRRWSGSSPSPYLTCLAASAARKALGGGGTELAEGQPGSRPAPEPSWVFGPHLAYKLWAVGPVGILFGLKYGVTNWGLHLVPTGTHLLLQVSNKRMCAPRAIL